MHCKIEEAFDQMRVCSSFNEMRTCSDFDEMGFVQFWWNRGLLFGFWWNEGLLFGFSFVVNWGHRRFTLFHFIQEIPYQRSWNDLVICKNNFIFIYSQSTAYYNCLKRNRFFSGEKACVAGQDKDGKKSFTWIPRSCMFALHNVAPGGVHHLQGEAGVAARGTSPTWSCTWNQ